MGKIIVIDGLDGCGKQTQSTMLYDKLRGMGYECMKVSYPNYGLFSSSLVKAYLNGELGAEIDKISPYAIHSFYASDRYITYLKQWKDFYEQDNTILIMDRYTQSSMIYQSFPFDTPGDIYAFCDHVLNYEHNLLGLPRADIVIALSLDFETSKKLMRERDDNKHGGQDIHEQQTEFLEKVALRQTMIGQQYNWEIIQCDSDDHTIKDREAIHQDIMNVLKWRGIIKEV